MFDTQNDEPTIKTPELDSVVKNASPSSQSSIDDGVGSEIAVTELESMETTSFRQVDPRSVTLERLSWWLLTAIVVFVLFAGWLVLGFAIRGTFDLTQWIVLLAIVGVAAGGLLCSRIFPKLVFASTTWNLSARGLEVRTGIFWKSRIFVCRDRIQHTDVSQGPLMRLHELATLVINTSGTHNHSISLSGLSLREAESVRDDLSRRPLFDPNGLVSAPPPIRDSE